MEIEISYLIPTLRSEEEITSLIKEIEEASCIKNIEIIASCTKNSASINRNLCLDKARGKYIIMMDDDITGLFRGWGEKLVRQLNLEVMAISPRLLRPDRSYALMMGDPFIYDGLVSTVDNKVCTACFCFENTDLRFDENFIGSGFEDDDFMIQLNQRFPNRKIVIDNGIHIVHINEMKNQKGIYWERNKSYFLNKWKGEKDRWHK